MKRYMLYNIHTHHACMIVVYANKLNYDIIDGTCIISTDDNNYVSGIIALYDNYMYTPR